MSVETGITSYGAYVPRHRLLREEIGDALGVRAGKGARTVAAFDEDSTTMGVEAGRRALNGSAPGSIHFATTTPAYFDKTNASAIHAALDLGHDGFAVDLAGSVRSGVGALRAAAAAGGMAILSDLRTGRPASADERDGGDAAAAFVFGADPIAEVLAQASMTAEFLDRWRAPGAVASQQWEERFGAEIYLPLIGEAVSRVLVQAGVEQADHVIVTSPHTRTVADAARRHPGRIGAEDPGVGYAGAADLGIRLASVLDRAAPGETILVIVAADGCDVTLLRATDRITEARAARPVADQVAGGREIRYATYLTWRGLLEREPPRRPEPDRPAGPPSARSEAWKFAFVGSRCEACGFIHVPPLRVCKSCATVDRMARAPLADCAGTVATYTVDRLAFSPSPPVINVVVDYDGGGRATVETADTLPDEIEIGTRVQMTFRRLYTTEGVHNYFWKARAV